LRYRFPRLVWRFLARATARHYEPPVSGKVRGRARTPRRRARPRRNRRRRSCLAPLGQRPRLHGCAGCSDCGVPARQPSARANAPRSDELFAELARLGPRAPACSSLRAAITAITTTARTGRGAHTCCVKPFLPDSSARTRIRSVSPSAGSRWAGSALSTSRVLPRSGSARSGGHSPALWRSGGETPPGAFDNAEDFARHDVIGAARRGKPLGQGPVWMDAGESDPFLEGNEGARAAVARSRARVAGRSRP
jgi:hypothetical protein